MNTIHWLVYGIHLLIYTYHVGYYNRDALCRMETELHDLDGETPIIGVHY